MLTDVPGISIGHWTNEEARTGCSVALLPPGTTASGEVRGGAPATREFALLDPSRLVSEVDAVVLSGGSAFGLAAADGVAQGLRDINRGFETLHGRVPIVVGMSLYDLGVGDPSAFPDQESGKTALAAALLGVSDAGGSGRVGAGCGATVNKWSGTPEPGGIGVATVRGSALGGQDGGTADGEEIVVSAMLAVNAFGAIDDGTTTAVEPPAASPFSPQQANTTIGIIATNAKATKADCFWLAQGGHDGLARSILPAHTHVDGDALVAVATGEVEADMMYLRALAQSAVVTAVRSLRAT